MNAFTLFALLKLDKSEYDKSMSDAEKEGKSFGSKLGTAAKVGAAAVAAVGAAATTASKALYNGAKEVASYGDNIDKMSQKIGISAEAYQEWDAVFQHSGANVNSLQQGMRTLNTQLNKVKDAASLAKSPMAQLGFSLEEVEEMAKDPDKALENVIYKLQELPAGAERSALATQLLGRSGVELGALLNQTAEDTKKMKDRVHELGGVMSNEAVKASAQFQDNMQDLHTALDGVKRNIISQTLPAFNDLIDGFTKLIAGEEGAESAIDSGMNKLGEAIDKIIPRVGELLEKLLPRVVEIGGKIVSTFATQLPKIVTSVAKNLPGVIKELVKALRSAGPEMINAGADLISDLADGMGTGDDTLMDAIMDAFEAILNAIIDNLPKILDAGMKILDKLVDGILNNLPKIADAVFQIIKKLGETIIEKLPEILQKGKDILLKLVKGITDNLPEIVKAAVQIIKDLLHTLVEHLPEILQAGIDLLLELAKGIFEALPDLIAQIPQIITDLISSLLSAENIGKLLDAGFQIISNIFTGLFDGDFGETAKDLILSLLEAILAIPGMIMDIGKNIMQGIWNGLKSVWNAVSDWIDGTVIGKLKSVNDYVQGIENATGTVATLLDPLNGNKPVQRSSGSRASQQNSNFVQQAATYGGTTINLYQGGKKSETFVANTQQRIAMSNGGYSY